jgi:hypothetical protein
MNWHCWTPEFIRIIAAAYSTIQTNPGRKARRAVVDMMTHCGVPGTPDDVLDIWGLALKFHIYTTHELIVTLSNDRLKVKTASMLGPEVEIEWPTEGSPDVEEIAVNIEAAWRSRRIRAETNG